MTALHPWPEIGLHVVAGSIGLLIGLIPLLSQKGGAMHRRFGRVFAFCAAVVMGSAITAIFLRNSFNAPVLSRITLSATYLLWGAWRALQNRTTGPRWLDYIASGFTAWFSVYLFYHPLPTTSSSRIPNALSNFTLYWIWTVLLYDLSRFWWRRLWCERVAPIEHGVKMVAVYFAMMSAGAGNLLSAYQPWSIFIPNLLGMLLMTGMVGYYTYLGARQSQRERELPIK